MLLEVQSLQAGYRKKTVLHGVSLQVDSGEIVALIGHNGAGKSSLLKAIFGLLTPRGGRVVYRTEPIHGSKPALNVRRGLAFVPQGHGVFPDLTVRENLELGAYSVETEVVTQRLEEVYSLFPILEERRWQKAGSLSGGQQQMLALGMALVLRPALLLLDEPSLGLAPSLVQRVMASVEEINRRFHTSILLVEQNVKHALRLAQRVYVMRTGQIIFSGTPQELEQHGALWKFF